MPVRAEIEGLPFSLLRDADKQHLQQLTFIGKIEWLKARVNLVLISPLRSALNSWEQDQLGMVLVTGLCAGISAASTFLKGRRPRPRQETDRDFFLDFVRLYMAPVEPVLNAAPNVTHWVGRPAATWAEWLYLYVRNGLAHAFTIEQGGFHHGLPALIDDSDPAEPVIDAARLLDAFERGWTAYLNDVRTHGEQSLLGRAFTTRWDDLFL